MQAWLASIHVQLINAFEGALAVDVSQVSHAWASAWQHKAKQRSCHTCRMPSLHTLLALAGDTTHLHSSCAASIGVVH